MTKTVAFIANPTSRRICSIVEHLAQRDMPNAWTLTTTKYHMHAVALARSLVTQGYKTIVAIGGDGTISQCISGYMEADGCSKGTVFAMIPAGTGNDFGRTIGVTNKDIFQIWNAILAGDSRKLDVGEVVYTKLDCGETERMYFNNVASFGISGDTINNLQNSSIAKYLTKGFSYWLMGVYTTLTYRAKPCRFIVNGETTVCDNLHFGAVCNGRFFGGNMMLSTTAQPDDRQLNLVVLKNMSIWKSITKLYWSLRDGKYSKRFSSQDWSETPAATITAEPVNSSDVIHLESDGELIGKLPATFTMHPQQLLIINL